MVTKSMDLGTFMVALAMNVGGYLHDPSKWCTKPSQSDLPTSNDEQYLKFIEDMSAIRPQKNASCKVHLRDSRIAGSHSISHQTILTSS